MEFINPFKDFVRSLFKYENKFEQFTVQSLSGYKSSKHAKLDGSHYKKLVLFFKRDTTIDNILFFILQSYEFMNENIFTASDYFFTHEFHQFIINEISC